MQIAEMEKKIDKIFLDLEIIALEMVALTRTFTEREYLSSGVNMLTNSLKISDTSKTEFLELIFFQNAQKIWQNNCCADLCSVLDHLTRSLSITDLTRGFLEV